MTQEELYKLIDRDRLEYLDGLCEIWVSGFADEAGDGGRDCLSCGWISDQMIIGRDILNQCCVKFDGKRQQFSFEEA
jgi:hypothetical protein